MAKLEFKMIKYYAPSGCYTYAMVDMSNPNTGSHQKCFSISSCKDLKKKYMFFNHDQARELLLALQEWDRDESLGVTSKGSIVGYMEGTI